jgi:hypothetical protein
MKRFSIILFLALFSFSGCSKEDNPTNPVLPPETTIKTGKFLDSPVEGITYRTETLEGLTNSKGEFQYKEREKVSFFVGSIKIGEALGNDILTPIDIALTPNATINSLEVKNIAAFLQTLDADKNPLNGLKISTEAVAALPAGQIDFKNHFIQLLGELVAEINQKVPMNLKVVFPEVAALHLANTLNLDYEISGLEAGVFFDIIENWETISRNVNWIHKFDSQGRISESMAFEKFPWRPILKHIYNNYNSNGYPQFYDGHYLDQNGSSLWTMNWYLFYDQNSNINTFSWSPPSIANPDYNVYDIYTVDEKRRVTEYTTKKEGALIANTILEYNDLNNSLLVKFFDHGVDEPRFVNEYFFTEFGSLMIWKVYSGDRLTLLTNRFYRENYTLEKLEIIKYEVSGEVLKTIDYKNENGGTYRVEKFSGDFLFELYERNNDRSSITTIYNKEDGSYYIEYRDTNSQKYKTEYYDSEKNLLYTEP